MRRDLFVKRERLIEIGTLVLVLWLLVGGNCMAAEADRDPMEDGRMSPMETTEEYEESGLLGVGSNNAYSSVTAIRRGIDVSKYQGNIDWNAVRASGIEYAFIRVGYRGMDQGTLVEDPYYKQNIEQATAAGIKVGVYIFSQAVNTAEAEQEADFIVSRIGNYKITMPVIIDYEFGNGMTGRLANANLSKQAGTDVCKAFCARVESKGYTSMVYANKNMFTNYIDGPQIANQYLIWLAQYSTQVTYSGNFDFWQYCSDGTVSGISGYVDMDYWFVKDGVEDFSINGLYYNDSLGWAYYRGGAVDTSYNGLATNGAGTWVVRNGIVDFSYTGMIDAGNGVWYYAEGGKINYSYTGMASNDYGWWYYVNGVLDWNYTGMAHNDQGWWYYTNGNIDWNYTGLGMNEVGTWYYKDGRIAWSCSDIVCVDGKWLKIDGGRVDDGYNDLYYSKTYGWWKIAGGYVDFGYTDLYGSATCGWWKVSGGSVDFDYTDLYCSPTYGWWKVKGGSVDFGYTDLYYSPTYGWWKVNGGSVDFGYTDLYYSPTYGWWKVSGGSVDFGYTELYNSPQYGWWKVNGGSVDFGYSGWYNSPAFGWWRIKGGSVVF